MLKIFGDFLTIINEQFIRGLFVSGLVLLLYRIVKKNSLVIDTALLFLRRFIVVYCLLTLTYYLLSVSMSPEVYSERISGAYWWSYTLILSSHLLLPLLLLTKRSGRNIYFFLVVAFFMNIGWVFEMYVIRMSSLHSNYSDQNPIWLFFPSDKEIAAMLKGVIIGLGAIGLAYIIEGSKKPMP